MFLLGKFEKYVGGFTISPKPFFDNSENYFPYFCNSTWDFAAYKVQGNFASLLIDSIVSPHCESLQIISPPCFESKSSFLQSKASQEKFELKNSVTLCNWKSASEIISHLEFKYSLTFYMATALYYNFQKSNCEISKNVKTAIVLGTTWRFFLVYFSHIWNGSAVKHRYLKSTLVLTKYNRFNYQNWRD